MRGKQGGWRMRLLQRDCRRGQKRKQKQQRKCMNPSTSCKNRGKQKWLSFSAAALRIELKIGPISFSLKMKGSSAISRRPKLCSELPKMDSERRTAFLHFVERAIVDFKTQRGLKETRPRSCNDQHCSVNLLLASPWRTAEHLICKGQF